MKLDYPVRLQVYLAKSGYGSRRSCELLMLQGRVTVNGKICNVLGSRVNKDDAVCVDGILAEPAEKLYYYALNKPRGYVCSNRDPHEKRLAVDLIDVPWSKFLFHVGRLDKDSSGLIIYTNDGDFANWVMRPSSEIEKEYIVQTDLVLREEDFKRPFSYYRIKRFQILDKTHARIILTEGKNREIRKFLFECGYEVLSLVRTRIGDVRLGDLPVGMYRKMTTQEILGLEKGRPES